MDAAAKGRPFSFRKPWVASSAEIARRDMRPLFGFCRCSRFARATSFGLRSLYFPASSPAGTAYSKSGSFAEPRLLSERCARASSRQITMPGRYFAAAYRSSLPEGLFAHPPTAISHALPRPDERRTRAAPMLSNALCVEP